MSNFLKQHEIDCNTPIAVLLVVFSDLPHSMRFFEFALSGHAMMMSCLCCLSNNFVLEITSTTVTKFDG